MWQKKWGNEEHFGVKKWKEFIWKLVWRSPAEWLENVGLGIMPWDNLMIMLIYIFKGGIMSR